jgi:heptosyltransferase-2
MELNIGQKELIVVLEIGGLGDFIMATPTLKSLRKHFPHNPITLFVAQRSVTLAEDFSRNIPESPFTIIPFWTTGNYLIRNLINLAKIKKVARQKPGLLIDLSAIESDAAAQRRKTFINLFNSKVTAGRNTDQRGVFFDLSFNETLFSKQHEVERKSQILSPLGIDGKPDKLDFFIGDESKKLIEDYIQKSKLEDKILIGINIGAYRSDRRWPIKNTIELIERLQTYKNFHFLIFGGKNDAEFIEPILKTIDKSKITPIVGIAFQIVGTWLRRTNLLITNDTGLMHFAAALRVPTIALFGPENPYRYAPWGDFPKLILKYYPDGENNFTEENIFFPEAICHIKPESVAEAASAFIKTGTFTKTA